MLSSMTAYAERYGNSFKWEIRSVNHRYLDVQFKLPEQFKDLELEFRQNIREFVHRGKIECFLLIENQKLSNEISINQAELNKLAELISQVSNTIGDVKQVSPLKILSWPGITTTKNTELLKQQIIESFVMVLKDLVQIREAEGNKIEDLIRTRVEQMQVKQQMLNDYYPELRNMQQEKLMAQIAELKVDIDQARYEQEIIYLLNKYDISEEIDRLGILLGEVNKLLDKSSIVGRKLDFLMQEIYRESNTLGTKSASSKISLTAVDLKVLVDQVREQAQNIE